MHRAILFDWGDTLMVDDKSQQGKMRYWDKIQLVNHVNEVLFALSQRYDLYVATGASDSTIEDIHAAFRRAEIADYFKGYFCRENIPFTKGSSDFYLAISTRLGLQPNLICMVGDSLQNDILPAKEAGLMTVWLTEEKSAPEQGVITIEDLLQLKSLFL